MLRTTLRSLWDHKRRLLSTTISVVLGVAFMAGTMMLGDTLDSTFDDLFADINEEVDVEVRGAELFDPGFGAVRSPLDESLVDDVAEVEGVSAAAGYVQTQNGRLIGSDGDTLGSDQGAPTLLSSWIPDPGLSGLQLVEGRGPEAEDEVAINAGAAEDGALQVGDPVEVLSAEGRVAYTLVGVYQIGGRDSAGGTLTADFLPEVAQRLAGQPGQFDTILARTGDAGTSQAQLVERVQEVVPDGTEVVTGEQAAEELADSISSGLSFFTTFLLVFAFIALAVGSFIIFNTFSILVAQRGKELALLRAIGASRRQVLASVLVEASLVGLVASVVGLVLGIGLAVGVQALLGGLGLDLPSSGTTLRPDTIVTAILVGLAVTLLSAVIPAWRATKVPPIAALRDVAQDRSGTSVVRLVIGLVVVAAAVASVLPAFGDDPDSGAIQSVGLGALLLLVGLVILGPVMARPLAKLLGSPLPLLRGTTGTLARENAARSPKRTASTAAALMIGVGLVAFITVFASSARASVDAEVNRGFLGDYVVQSSAFDLGVPLSFAEDVGDVEGVASVASIQQGGASVRLPDGDTANTFLGAVDPERFLEVIDVRMAEGRLTDLEPGGIVVDRQVARNDDLGVGDTVEVTFTTAATAELTVAAISDDPTLLGQWTITQDDWSAAVPNATDAVVFIDLEQGADADAALAVLDELAEPYPTIEVQDRNEFLGSIASMLNQLLNVVYGLLALSVIIALIGIANTLSLSIHERTRELGLLRAVGMSRRQLRSAVRWEAAIIALIGTVLGLVVGLLLSWVLVEALKAQGFSQYRVPGGPLAVIVVVFAALGVLASVLPARRAARLDVLKAIATE
jgi:putative ABC transport system permease protein